MVMSPFRRNVRADTQRKGGKGGGKGSYFEKLRLPQNTPTPFMLIRSEYTDRNPAPEEIEVDAATGRPKEVKKPYHKSRIHTRKTLQNGREFFATETCSAGFDPHNPQPCVGCYAMDSGDKSVGVKDNHAFGIVHLIPYHRHPMIDKQTGGIAMKRDNSGMVMIDTECSGRTCNFCRVLNGQQPIPDPTGRNNWPGYRPQDISTVFGKRRYIETGKNHLGDLMGWDQIISSVCAHDGASILVDGYRCPTCNSTVIDMQNDPRDDAQIADAVSKPYPCLTCQRPVFLQEVVACEVCEQSNRQPLQHGILDVVLWGMKQGENTNSHLVLQRSETLDQFARSVPPQLLGGKSLQEVVAELAKPYDFDQIYQPKDLQEQAKRLSLPVPPSANQGSFYGGQPGQGTPQMAPAGYGQPAMTNPQGLPAQAAGQAPVAPPQYQEGAIVNGHQLRGGQWIPLPAGAVQQAPQPPAYQPPVRGNFGR